MAKVGKKYAAAKAQIEKGKLYTAVESIELAKKVKFANFDESVEVSFNLNVDPRHADQQIRGAMVLPHGTGKTQKVLVITQGPKVQEATDAGADFVGGKELLEDIKNGWFEFDVIVATPDMMGELGKLGRVLGPKGLMPNPKTGTVTTDITRAVEEIKKGKVEYRVDKEGNINVMIGKSSFDDTQLLENFQALHQTIVRVRPAAVKGSFIKTLTLSTTMGPAVKVQPDLGL
ncbi:MAG: 50S ribosomal protein L1 [Erysipelothrix sp.]|nr:50S ribosomal protein L1 [Erysipelothrix sp.]